MNTESESAAKNAVDFDFFPNMEEKTYSIIAIDNQENRTLLEGRSGKPLEFHSVADLTIFARKYVKDFYR